MIGDNCLLLPHFHVPFLLSHIPVIYFTYVPVYVQAFAEDYK